MGHRVLLAYRKLLRRPTRLRVVSALLLLLAVWGATRIRVNLNIYQLQDAGIPSTESLAQMRQRFGEGLSAHWIIAPLTPESRLTQRQACELKKFFSRPRAGIRAFGAFDLLSPQRDVYNQIVYRPLLTPDCSSNEPFSLNSALAGSPWVGLLTDRELRDLAFEVRFTDTSDPKQWLAEFDHFTAEAEAQLPSGFRSFWVGRASSQWFFQRSMHEDLWVHGVMVGGIACLFRLFFGTWIAGLFFGATLAFTVLMVVGLMGLAGSPIDVLNNGLFLMTAVGATEDFIFLSYCQLERPRRRTSAFISTVLPGFWTSFTTFIGFGSLVISPMLMMRRFGFWAAIAALIEWGAIFLFLPAFSKTLNGRVRTPRWVNTQKAIGLGFFKRVARVSVSRGLGRALLLLLIVGAIGYGKLKINGSDEIFPEGHALDQGLKYVSKSRGWEAPIHVMFPEDTSPEDRKSLIHQITQLPSVAQVVTKDAILDFLTRSLEGTSRELVKREISASRPLQEIAHLDGSERAMVFFKHTELEQLADSIEQVRNLCGTRCTPTGELVVASESAQKVLAAMRESFVLSIILVALTLFFLSWRLPLSVRLLLVVTSVWGPITLYGIVWLGHLPVDLLSNMVGTILIGLTGDNALQFIFAAGRKPLTNGLERRAGASVMILTVAVLGSLALRLLSIASMQRLGLMLSLGFAIAFLGDLALLRAQLPKLRHPTRT